MAEFRSGFVSIVGSPNAGKSTLMNTMVGQKVAIVTRRAQTTRNKIMGVLTRDGYQIIFIDTPGIHTPKDKLGQYMVKTAYDAVNEVECVLLMIDPVAGIMERDEEIISRLSKVSAPVLAVVNKTDVANIDQAEAACARLEKESYFKGIFKLSAKTGDNIEKLEQAIAKTLVPGPMYFPPDMVTDMPERIVCQEFVREAAMKLLDKEIPYGIGVDIDKMAAREGITDVFATIYCERDSQKGIIIGRGGSMLKKIGAYSRKEMEWMLGTRVNLQLWVKVRSDWRNSNQALRELGYSDAD